MISRKMASGSCVEDNDDGFEGEVEKKREMKLFLLCSEEEGQERFEKRGEKENAPSSASRR
jgi:hypothetical protein